MALSVDTIQQLYVAYFGRPADPGGLIFYGSFDEASLVRSFAASPESQAFYGGAMGASVINVIYQNLFNRDAEPAGLAAWTALLNSGQLSPAGIALAILRGAANDDKITVVNKLAAAATFTSHVDTVAEIVGYAGTGPAAIARAYLKGVTSNLTSLNSALAGVDQAVYTATNNITDNGGGIPAGSTFPLTALADTLVGTAGNDSFTSSTAGFFASGDSIDGGAGTDTLTVTGETAAITGAGITVRNVANANLTTAGTFNLDTTTWTGLTQLTATGAGAMTLKAGSGVVVSGTTSALGNSNVIVNGGSAVTVNATGVGNGNITIGGTTQPTGAITVSASSGNFAADSTMGAITVTGGSSVTVNQSVPAGTNPNHTTTVGTVTISGKALTTSVTVNNPAVVTGGAGTTRVAANTVAVYDINGGSASTAVGKINTISVSNYTVVGIQDNALTNLSLTGGSGNMIIDNSDGGLAVGLRTTTLNLTVNGLTGGTLDDADIYTTLNVTTTGADSRFANITFGALTALNVAGLKVLTVTSGAGMTALHTVGVTGSAGLVANLATPGTVTSVNTSGTTGTSSLTLNANQATFTGGAGVDNIALSNSTVSKAIDLGAGDDSLTLANSTGVPTASVSGGLGTDTLTMDATSASTANNSGSGAFAAQVTGFEKLVLTGATNQTVDLATLGNYSDVTTFGGNGLTLSGFASGGTLTLTGAGTSYNVGNSAFAAGLNDTINVKLTSATGSGVGFATTGLVASGVENVNITSGDTQAGGPTGTFNNTFTLLGNSATAIKVSGTAGLTLSATDTAATSVDASGITVGGFTFTSGNLAGAATVKGSATGTNTVDVSATSQAVTYVGGSGVDNVTLGSGANVLTGAGGADSFIFAAGASTASHLTTITDYRAASGANAGAADTINLTGITTVASNVNTVQDLSAQATLTNALNVMANAMTTSNGLGVFVYRGDEYVYVETTGVSTTYSAADTVVKLAGVPFVAGTSVVGLGIDGV